MSREVSSPLDNTNNFDIYQETGDFQEKEAFKDISEICSFLSYYKDFKLVLCSTCKQGITGFNTHLYTYHFQTLSKKEKKVTISTILTILNTLEVLSLEESLKLIYKFINQFSLFPFKELTILSGVFQCLISDCFTVKTNKANIIRHLREEHSDIINKEVSISTYYKVIKGQNLISNRLYFPITEKNKQVEIIEEDSYSEEEEEESLQRAKLALKESFIIKKDEYFNKLSSFKLDPKEKLTPFQIKTRYLEFISKYNSKDLLDLCSPLSEEETELEILVLNLKEILYLSLEKSIFLNKIHLNLLNSFKSGEITVKGFKPLLNPNSRVNYFGFFSNFFSFFYRSIIKEKYLKKDRLFKVDNKIVNLIKELSNLARAKSEENQIKDLKSNLNLKSIKKSLNKKLRNLTLEKFLNQEKESSSNLEEREEDNNSDFSSSISRSSLSDSESSDSESSDSESSDSESSDSLSLDNSSSKDILNNITEINKSEDKISLEIKDKLIELLIILLKQETDLYIFDSCINSYFASKSIRDKDLSIKNTLELSQYYSKFLYSYQLIIIEYSFRELIKNPKNSLFNILKDITSNYFTNSSKNSIAELLSHRLYCFKVNRELSSSSTISISSIYKETISYKKVTISVDNLRTMFKDLVSTSYTFLVEKLLFNISSKEYKEVTLEEFSKVEDRDLSTPYQCFRDLHPNSKNYYNFLYNKVIDSSTLREKFFSFEEGNLIINTIKVKEYLKDILEFKKYCLLLIYLLTGLPLRGTELVTLRYLNSFKDKREIFLDISSSLFICNISYYKGQSISEKTASNIRYLPKSVSYIFLLFIVLVDPFIDFLNITSALKTNQRLSCYFFIVNKRLLESRDLGLRLYSFSTLSIGQRIGIQTYRQLITGIIKIFMKEDLDLETLTLQEKENSSNSIKANMMNHSISIEELHYARSLSTFTNIKGSSQIKYLAFCLRYFSFFKLDLINLSQDLFRNSLYIRAELQTQENLNIVNSLAIRFSKLIESSNLNPSRKHQRQVSSISSSLVDNKVYKKTKVSDLVNLSTSTSSSDTLINLLREFLQDNQAIYKIEEQELLVKAILLKVPFILAVLPTNSGKTLTYLLTASLSISKVTIVIVPLLGLKVDILRRAREFNIPCSVFEDNKEISNLTLVSIESIITPSFITIINNLINSNSLDRIIIDECHLLITSSNYRSIMFRFKEILLKTTQFVFLTGTLPISIEKDLKELLLLEDLSIIRANCSRDNISYKAITYKTTDLKEQEREILDYINTFKVKEFESSKDKVLIFCPSFNSIESLASTLNCSSYNSSLSNEEKKEVLSNFITKTDSFYSILVSSSALEEGFDYSFIRLVIYKDYCYSFIGFLQGSSRGGRDNLPCTSLFIYKKGEEREREEDLNKSLFRAYLRETVCRRRQIDLYLNNNITDTCLSKQIKCDLCLSRENIQERQVSRIVNSTKEVEEKRLKIIRDLRASFNNCCYCFVLESPEATKHTASNCIINSESEKLAKEILKTFKKNYILEDNSCCFRCLLPTVICTYLKETDNCLNKKFMFRIIAHFYLNQEELNIKSKFNITSATNIRLFIYKFIKKVYIKELDTEGIFGFQVLTFN